MKSILSCVFVILIVGCDAKGVLVNQKVVRKIDLTTNLVSIFADITLRNDGDSVVNSFDVYIPTDQASHLSDISAQLKGKTLVVSEAVTTGQGAKFSVTLLPALAGADTAKVTVQTIFTHLLKPFPSEIVQSENQLVVYNGLLRFYSPYRTEADSTDVQLPSPSVESYTEAEKLIVKGTILSYGSFSNVAPFTSVPLRVHYQNNFPFMTFRTALKEVEVSHWGHLSFEEHIFLEHTGAHLKGGFSRLDYQRNPGASPSNFRMLRAHLPASAHTIYYRDIIGNISTSRAHVHESEGSAFTKLELFARYLLFGGWKTEFYYGYAVPLAEFLKVDQSGKYVLEFPLGTAVLGAVVDELTTRVILPEGATDIVVSGVQVTKEVSTRLTYLDTIGRPVITLRKKNVVGDNAAKVTLTYSFSNTFLYFDAFLLIAVFYLLFLVAIFAGRYQLFIGKFSRDAADLKEAAQEISNRLHRFDASFEDSEHTLATFKPSLDQLRKEMSPKFEALLGKLTELEEAVTKVCKTTDAEKKATALSEYKKKLHELDRDVTSKL